ncbi:protein rep [Fusobacterium sp.]|uniref:protein rep n=1 Tax=Fusobacterium sp. TaxID=68766 RepID=UPI000C704978|nr:protein rep [Fusobacterium sp.]
MDNTGISSKNQGKNERIEKHNEKKRRCKEFVEYMGDKNIKLDRLEACSNYLLFQANKDKTAFLLSGGNFCNNRFCPVCSWLKAKKMAFELLELLKIIQIQEDKVFIFITLTVPNVPSSELRNTIEHMNVSFNRLWKTKEFKAMNKGFIRKLEITYNEERNDFHPHFHIVCCVNKSYFTSRDYLKKRRLLELWQKSARNENITQVDIKPCKMDSIKQVLELATYSAKQSQLYLNKEIFDGFYEGMYRKKLIVFNGVFKEYRKKIEKKEINVDEIMELAELKEKAVIEIAYNWENEIDEYQEKKERILREEEQKSFYNLQIEIE